VAQAFPSSGFGSIGVSGVLQGRGGTRPYQTPERIPAFRKDASMLHNSPLNPPPESFCSTQTVQVHCGIVSCKSSRSRQSWSFAAGLFHSRSAGFFGQRQPLRAAWPSA